MFAGHYRVMHSELLEHSAQFLESALVLGARLARSVAPSVGSTSLWLRLCCRLGHGFGDGLSGTLDFGAGFSGAVAPSVSTSF